MRLNEWRRESAARKASRAAAEEALRSARRLVSDELTRNMASTSSGPSRSCPPVDELWRNHRDQLATGRTDDEWNAVMRAYRFLAHTFLSGEDYRTTAGHVDEAVRALWPSGTPPRANGEIPEPPAMGRGGFEPPRDGL